MRIGDQDRGDVVGTVGVDRELHHVDRSGERGVQRPGQRKPGQASVLGQQYHKPSEHTSSTPVFATERNSHTLDFKFYGRSRR